MATNIEQIKKHFLVEISNTINEIYNGDLVLDLSVVAVDANVDATVITCYFDFVNNKQEQIAILEENKNLIKKELARKSSFKKFPELIFDYDAEKYFKLHPQG